MKMYFCNFQRHRKGSVTPTVKLLSISRGKEDSGDSSVILLFGRSIAHSKSNIVGQLDKKKTQIADITCGYSPKASRIKRLSDSYFEDWNGRCHWNISIEGDNIGCSKNKFRSGAWWSRLEFSTYWHPSHLTAATFWQPPGNILFRMLRFKLIL